MLHTSVDSTATIGPWAYATSWGTCAIERSRRPDNILLKDVRMERERKLMLNTVHDVDESYEVEDFRTALLL